VGRAWAWGPWLGLARRQRGREVPLGVGGGYLVESTGYLRKCPFYMPVWVRAVFGRVEMGIRAGESIRGQMPNENLGSGVHSAIKRALV
jgi:hypothetical protein